MKKFVFLIIFLFIFCVFRIASQEDNSFRSEWSLGVNAGASFSKMRFVNNRANTRVPQELLNQFSGGVVVRYISEKHFGIIGELNISQRGWKDEKDDEFYFNTYSRSLTYIELPLLTHIYFDLGKRVRFVFNVGPQVGYNIGDKVLERIIPPGSEAKEYYDMKIDRKFEYGIKGCLGLELRTGIGSFILDGRYYYGLSDVFDNSRDDYFQASSNQILGVNLSYLIPFK